MKVPRRKPAARTAAPDRARPVAARGAARPGTRAVRGRTPARPAPAADPAPAAIGAAAAGRPAGRQSPFTRRAAVFAAVVLLVAISVAYPAQRYVAQRQHVDALRAQVSAGTARVNALEHSASLLARDTYVEREARRRLHFVMPGDLGYRVEDPETSTGPAAGPGTAVDPAATDAWWERMLGSLGAAAVRVEPPPVGGRS